MLDTHVSWSSSAKTYLISVWNGCSQRQDVATPSPLKEVRAACSYCEPLTEPTLPSPETSDVRPQEVEKCVALQK